MQEPSPSLDKTSALAAAYIEIRGSLGQEPAEPLEADAPPNALDSTASSSSRTTTFLTARGDGVAGYFDGSEDAEVERVRGTVSETTQRRASRRRPFGRLDTSKFARRSMRANPAAAATTAAELRCDSDRARNHAAAADQSPNRR